MYVRDKVVQDTTYWKCEFFKSKHCRARIHTRDGEIVRRWKTAHVSHTGDAGAVEAAEIRSTLKRKTLASDHAPAADSLATASQSAVAALPPEAALKRNINNARKGKSKYPKLPKHRKDIVIPQTLLLTKRQEDFLVHDSGLGDEDRILIFGTKNNAALLKMSKLWLVDGTFKTAPLLFYQLYTIHGVFESETFPLFYALLPNKTSITYTNMIREIKTITGTCTPKTVLMDFELAVIKVFKASDNFSSYLRNETYNCSVGKMRARYKFE